MLLFSKSRTKFRPIGPWEIRLLEENFCGTRSQRPASAWRVDRCPIHANNKIAAALARWARRKSLAHPVREFLRLDFRRLRDIRTVSRASVRAGRHSDTTASKIKRLSMGGHRNQRHTSRLGYRRPDRRNTGRLPWTKARYDLLGTALWRVHPPNRSPHQFHNSGWPPFPHSIVHGQRME